MSNLIEVFNNCSISGNAINPPSREVIEMERKLYADFKKLLTQNLGKWIGGKKQHFEFSFDPTDLLNKLRGGEKPNYKQEWHYFPTPEDVVIEMLNTHIPCGEVRCLEPSAGRGAIIDYMNNGAGSMANITWDAVEIEPTNRKILQEKGVNLVGEDFDTFKTDEKYDVIYANPPFKKALLHVEKMLDIIYKGGSCVIILPSNFEEKYKSKIQKWEETFEYIDFRNLREKSFKDSGTNIDTVIMYACYKQ